MNVEIINSCNEFIPNQNIKSDSNMIADPIPLVHNPSDKTDTLARESW